MGTENSAKNNSPEKDGSKIMAKKNKSHNKKIENFPIERTLFFEIDNKIMKIAEKFHQKLKSREKKENELLVKVQKQTELNKTLQAKLKFQNKEICELKNKLIQ